MAKPKLLTVHQLKKIIEKKHIPSILSKDVSKTIRNTLKENVVTEVYDRYTPKSYKRTGGLLQDENIRSELQGENTLIVGSTRSDGDKYVAGIIETGQGYMGDLNDVIGKRPFHEKTASELNQKKAHVRAFKDGMKKAGFDMK